MLLWDRVISIEELYTAWENVRDNDSGPGIDGITEDEFEREKERYILNLHNNLKTNKYAHSPIKIIDIGRNTKTRRIGMSCMKDKVVQQSITQNITDILEPFFIDNSFAYRNEKGAIKAIQCLENILHRDFKFFLRSDIDNYFENIDHVLLLDKLSHCIHNEELLSLIKKMIEAPEMIGNHVMQNIVGISQGSILSPLLSNYFLIDFDKFMFDKFGSTYIRYSDDFLAISKEKFSDDIIQDIKKELALLKLYMNDSKTYYESIEYGFDFLGYSFSGEGKKISLKSIEAFIAKLHTEWDSSRKLTFEERITKLGRAVDGWKNYYSCSDEKPVSVHHYIVELHKAGNENNPYKLERLLNIKNIYQTDDNEIIKFINSYSHSYMPDVEYIAEDNINDEIQKYVDAYDYEKAEELFEKKFETDNDNLIGTSEYIQCNNTIDYGKLAENNFFCEMLIGVFINNNTDFAFEEIVDNNNRIFIRKERPLELEDIKKHILGEKTIGTYIRDSNKSDKLNEMLRLTHQTAIIILNEASKLGLYGYLEDSGYKGRHLWFFLDKPINCKKAHNIGILLSGFVKNPFKDILIEIFPDRKKHTDEMGEIIKMPFGVHSLTGQRCLFLNKDGSFITDAFEFFKTIKRNKICHIEKIFKNMNNNIYTDEEKDNYRTHIIKDITLFNKYEKPKIIADKCKIINYLICKAIDTGYLTHFERLDILHVFGHLGKEGNKAIHAIMKKTINYSADITEKYIGKLPPNPVGCFKLSEKNNIKCHCDFDNKIKKYGYDTPLNLLTSRNINNNKLFEIVISDDEIKITLEKYLELNKQLYFIKRKRKEYERILNAYFDNKNIDQLEIAEGVLKRIKKDVAGEYDWILDI